ncbi:MAG: hypothetical protein GY749_48305 [Desulfobacteraceae bacterium]|nr:hypothetical protein [Desulfobacteraceae bacterium]
MLFIFFILLTVILFPSISFAQSVLEWSPTAVKNSFDFSSIITIGQFLLSVTAGIYVYMTIRMLIRGFDKGQPMHIDKYGNAYYPMYTDKNGKRYRLNYRNPQDVRYLKKYEDELMPEFREMRYESERDYRISDKYKDEIRPFWDLDEGERPYRGDSDEERGSFWDYWFD